MKYNSSFERNKDRELEPTLRKQRFFLQVCL